MPYTTDIYFSEFLRLESKIKVATNSVLDEDPLWFADYCLLAMASHGRGRKERGEIKSVSWFLPIKALI